MVTESSKRSCGLCLGVQALCGLLFPLQDSSTSTIASGASGSTNPSAEALRAAFLSSGYISSLLCAINLAYADSARQGGNGHYLSRSHGSGSFSHTICDYHSIPCPGPKNASALHRLVAKGHPKTLCALRPVMVCLHNIAWDCAQASINAVVTNLINF